MSGKKNPDGSKRRTSHRSKGEKPAVPFPVPAPLPQGEYIRRESTRERGEKGSPGEFVTHAFGKLAGFAKKEFEGQRAGALEPNGFKCHGDAEARFGKIDGAGASYHFEIHGVRPENPLFNKWLEDIETTAGVVWEMKSADFESTVALRIRLLAERAHEVITEQLDSIGLHPFALAAFLRVPDFAPGAELLIHFLFEQRPPRAFPGNAANRSDLS